MRNLTPQSPGVFCYIVFAEWICLVNEFGWYCDVSVRYGIYKAKEVIPFIDLLMRCVVNEQLLILELISNGFRDGSDRVRQEETAESSKFQSRAYLAMLRETNVSSTHIHFKLIRTWFSRELIPGGKLFLIGGGNGRRRQDSLSCATYYESTGDLKTSRTCYSTHNSNNFITTPNVMCLCVDFYE